MKRWFFNIVAGVSLLLLILTIAVRVHPIPKLIWGNERIATKYQLDFDGGVAFQTSWGWKNYTQIPPGGGVSFVNEAGTWEFAGMLHVRATRHILDADNKPLTSVLGYIDDYYISNLWLRTLFSILPIAWWTLWILHRRKIIPGHCRVCGYDLRATPDRCPECGETPTAKTMAMK